MLAVRARRLRRDTAGDGDMLYLETADSILGSESADASAMRPAGALEAGTSLSTPANAAAARLAMMSNSSNVSVARVGVARCAVAARRAAREA